MVQSAFSPIRLKFTQNVSLDIKPSQKIFGSLARPPHPNLNNMTVNGQNSKIHALERSSKILNFFQKNFPHIWEGVSLRGTPPGLNVFKKVGLILR